MKVFSKNILLLIVGMMASAVVCAQPQSNYYLASALDGKCGQELELALKNIVYPHSSLDYGALWEAFQTTDPGPIDSIPSWYSGGKTDLVYDMYAWMCQFPKFYSDKNHTQTGGFNREHCVPNSWWGGESGNAVAYTDLHHLLPSDGAANNAKGNFALGEYKSGFVLSWPTTTQTNTRGEEYVCKDEHNHVEGEPCLNNASHVWKNRNSTQYGGSSELFEPADIYKGDFARMYLYVVCAYEGELTWKTNYMFKSDDEKHTTILPWAKELLLKWHRQDPVSDKERARNNAIETLQHNRNPFIDYPELVEYIWGNKSTSSEFSLANAVSSYGTEGQKTEATITATWKTTLSDSEADVYTVIYNGDGALAVESSNTNVANASISGSTVTVTPVAAGTSTITISAPATASYTAAEKKYTLTVVEAFTPASLPFIYDGGKSDITPSAGMTQSGLGSDYNGSPKLKFDGSGDYLTIQFGEAAYLLSFVIKGNSFSDGTFKVLESADGENYSNIKVYSKLGTARVEASPLNPESRFVKFLYENKSAGNVALGSIRISNEYQRIVTEGNYGTICLPKSVPAGVFYGATFYSISGVTKSGTSISGVVLTEEKGKLEAGMPYVFKATGSSLAVAYEGESVSNAISATGLVGNLSSTPIDVPQGAYILSQNKLCKLAGGNATVAQNRAYFDLSNVAEVSAASSSYVIIDVEEEGSANGLETISVTKNQEMYDITGRRVNVATKGMFIKDGKKVIVK